jgi:PAXNEB protein.
MSSSFRRSGSTSSRPTQTPLSSSSTSLHQQDKDHSPSIPHQSSISTSSSKRPLSSPSPAAVLERVGTKPWIGGLTLTSTGLRELDAIVGGGQPLGTAILVEEDRWTQDLALCLVRYWSAEVSE